MQNQYALPPGFISIEDAIKLIKKDTAKEATVDLKFLRNSFEWIQEKHNLTIPLLKTENGRVKQVGYTFVHVADKLQLELLKDAIRTAWRERTKKELDETPVRHITTARGGEAGTSASGKPEVNMMGRAKVGDDIPAHTISQTLTGEGV